MREQGLLVPPPARLDPGLALALGQTYLGTGDAVTAIPFLRHAANACTTLIDPYRKVHAELALGDAWRRRKEHDPARAAYQRVLDRWGSRPETSVTVVAARAGLAAIDATEAAEARRAQGGRGKQ
jgi:hypothetical protein